MDRGCTPHTVGQGAQMSRPTKPPTGDGDGENLIRTCARMIEDGIHQGVGIRFCNDRTDPLRAKPHHPLAKPPSSDDNIEILNGPPPNWRGPYVHVKKEASTTVKSEPTDVRLPVKPDPDKPSFSALSTLPQSKGSAVKAGTKVTSTKATLSAELREGIACVFDPEICRAQDIAKYDHARQLQEDSFHFQENYRLCAELDRQRDTNNQPLSPDPWIREPSPDIFPTELSPMHAPKQLPVDTKGSEGESGLKMAAQSDTTLFSAIECRFKASHTPVPFKPLACSGCTLISLTTVPSKGDLGKNSHTPGWGGGVSSLVQDLVFLVKCVVNALSSYRDTCPSHSPPKTPAPTTLQLALTCAQTFPKTRKPPERERHREVDTSNMVVGGSFANFVAHYDGRKCHEGAKARKPTLDSQSAAAFKSFFTAPARTPIPDSSPPIQVSAAVPLSPSPPAAGVRVDQDGVRDVGNGERDGDAPGDEGSKDEGREAVEGDEVHTFAGWGIDIPDPELAWPCLNRALNRLIGYDWNVQVTYPRQIKGVLLEPKVRKMVDAAILLERAGARAPCVAHADMHASTNLDQPSSPDVIEIVSYARMTKGKSAECKGFELVVPHGRSALVSYPVLLHNDLNPPWSLHFINGLLYLRAIICIWRTRNVSFVCDECAVLPNNATLVNIVSRMDGGIHSNTKWMYPGAGGLLDLLQQKDQHQRNTILLHLNQTCHLAHIEGVLFTHKSILCAIASRRLPNVDQALRVAMRQGMSASSILQVVTDVSMGKYKPKGFMDDNYRIALILLLHAIAAVLPLQASPMTPSIEDVVQNVDMAFGPLLYRAAAIWRPVHRTVRVDKITTEAHLRWNDATNHVLGICREHIGKRDVEVLVEEVKRKVIHHTVEATVCAVTLLSPDTWLGSAQPIAVSGTCKAEKVLEHRKLLQTMLDGIAAAKALQGIRIVCYASDGISHLPLLDLWVGDDNLTVDKDYKHVAFKRVHNAVLRANGINVLGMLPMSEILCTHLQDESQILDLKEPMLTALFNVADKQDVNLTYRLAFLIWELRRVLIPNHRETTYIQQRKAIVLFADLWFNLMTPYICITLFLSDQLLRLSTAAHMLLTLYFHEGAKSHFLPNPLFIDIMLIIKNTYFCIAKVKADNLRSTWFLIWMGTDSLESIFRVVQIMVGNDSNADMLQLVQCLSHSVKVTNVFAEHKKWDQGPNKKPADNVNHINVSSWLGDTCVDCINLGTCWSKGRFEVEDSHPLVRQSLESLPTDATILAPFGGAGLLFSSREADDSQEDGLGLAEMQTSVLPTEDACIDRVDSANKSANAQSDGDDQDPCYDDPTYEFEDQLQAEATVSANTQFGHTIRVGNITMNKSCTLTAAFRFCTSLNSTDCLQLAHTVAGPLVLPINSDLTGTPDGAPAFIFEGEQLPSLAMALNERIALSHITPDVQYPYRNDLGYACFLVEYTQDGGDSAGL
ncbi:hypothetical protein K488DRAFT_75011 [Vararia minispora EC-137]|uniref:Uncharacterized protein n=1 Tax=Vararia minispora EC-137 TaxID=1314806 RepID=A0ACB8Q537_9AGAM|nr:hypothetical protein K488DRAFT_75011 [Vararia minispora EC-137]